MPEDERQFLVLTTGVTGKDGLSRFSREILNALAALVGTDRVHCWSLNDDSRLAEEIPCSVRGASGSRLRLALWALSERLKPGPSVELVVVHVHLLPLAFLMGACVRGVTQWLIGIEVWKELSFFQTRAMRKVERLLSISAHTVERFRSANPELAHLGVEVCHPGIASQPRVSTAPRDAKRALLVARMSADERYKGHDLLMDIWPRVREQVPTAELIFVGDGDDRERLTAKSQRLGLGEAVRFLGRVSDERLAKLYSETSVFVMPSRDEGFGLVFLEAMRSSRACIGAVGAASEIIEQGNTGYIVSYDDGEELYSCLVGIFLEKDLRARMEANARQRFEREFTDGAFRQRLGAGLGIEP